MWVYKTYRLKYKLKTENPRDTKRVCVLKYLGRMHLRCIFPPEYTTQKLLNELVECVGNQLVGCCSWCISLYTRKWINVVHICVWRILGSQSQSRDNNEHKQKQSINLQSILVGKKVKTKQKQRENCCFWPTNLKGNKRGGRRWIRRRRRRRRRTWQERGTWPSSWQIKAAIKTVK